MVPTHFLWLPDITFLEIFGYLSYEDNLYAFVHLHDSHPLSESYEVHEFDILFSRVIIGKTSPHRCA